jgi:energy-coupling factor transporter ATP-binding protein EcfA2
MYVEKIEIPAFRVLRDVVLEFGEIYDPQIFPIGSENGGGKSTLLQLVFALLHCSAEESRHAYLQNLLASDFYAGDEDERMLARLTVRIEGKSHALEFISLHGRFLGKKLHDPPPLGFETWDAADAALASWRRLDEQLERHQYQRTRDRHQDVTDEQDLALIQKKVEDLRSVRKTFQADIERVNGLLVALSYKLITTHPCQSPTGWETRALICHIPGQSASQAEELLLAVASKVFLLGPSNQQYLFLGKGARKALIAPTPRPPTAEKKDPPRPQITYLTKLAEAESAMTGFYAYDWLSVEPLVQLFAAARDEDFKSVVKTGDYGESYTTLMREVNELLLGKKVRPLEDLSGVEFIVEDGQGHEIPLSPEDLSQGELKRLMIYAWLRANKAVDALVLIDEIEASFHPDWQVGIVRDLQDWAPKNQYLLATHSYELCQALTPRHVRELQPKLSWREAADEAEQRYQDSSDG